MNLDKFILLSSLFLKNGFNLYLVGGTSRDYLLKRETNDFDLASDATPNEIKKFLSPIDETFIKYGVIKYQGMDIVTFRKESGYKDYRHPSKVIFTKDIKEDYLRRDFTINAIYIDKDLRVYDFSSGLDDLKNKIIRFIGDPEIRVKEDPLRILRARRFASSLGFTIEKNTLNAINKYEYLLDKLNPDKIMQELKKC